ncbi:MAG: O-methyltransferase [Proteobacteria bacterium]|nr:O-methyltransferase [Pseudomonadota bacterium]
MSVPRDALREPFDAEMRDYVLDLAGESDALVDRMELYARERDFPIVGRNAGRWLEMLARMVGAKQVLEIGSGFGYSAFFFARAVGEDGRVVCVEHHAHEVVVGEVLYTGHPFGERLEWVSGDGAAYLQTNTESWDVLFVDVEKADYAAMLALAVPRLRPGGLVIFDNALWGGRVTREASDEATRGVQAFNEALFAHPELDAHILPAGDGLAVARKR